MQACVRGATIMSRSVGGDSVQVVHIDLGVAFEQGRFLNTPELVPFRLTRDVVDGMGAMGAAAARPGSCSPPMIAIHLDASLQLAPVSMAPSVLLEA